MLSLYKLEHFLGIKMKDLFWKSVCLYLSVSMSVYLLYSGKVWWRRKFGELIDQLVGY